MQVDLHTICEQFFTLLVSCMEYKWNEVWTKTKLNDKTIQILCLNYFEIQIRWQVSNFWSQSEFHLAQPFSCGFLSRLTRRTKGKGNTCSQHVLTEQASFVSIYSVSIKHRLQTIQTSIVSSNYETGYKNMDLGLKRQTKHYGPNIKHGLV